MVAEWPTKIVVDIVDPGDGEIKVTHTFWGHSESEARTNCTHHLGACEYVAAAAEAGNVIEEEFEISDDGDGETCDKCGEPLEECTC